MNLYENIIIDNFESLAEGKQQHYLPKFFILKKKKNHNPQEFGGNTNTGVPKSQL